VPFDIVTTPVVVKPAFKVVLLLAPLIISEAKFVI